MAKCSSFIRLPSLWGWSNEHQHIERDIEKGLLPFLWGPIYVHTWVERDNVESWWLLCDWKAHCHGMSMCRQPFDLRDACVKFQTKNWLNLFAGSVKATQTESYSDNWLWKQVRFIIWNMEFCWMDLCKIHVNYGCLATGEGTKIQKIFQLFLLFGLMILFDGICPPDINNNVKSNERVRHFQFWTTKVRKRNVRFLQVFKFQIML